MNKMDHLLYGAAYYEEYLPYDRLEKDMAMIKNAGMNVVRIGESTWSTCEPQNGVFDFSHMKRVIEEAGKVGISVIIGTPTYAVPTWLVKAYPEVLAITHKGQEVYGRRQNMDITNPVYLHYAERIIKKMMEECASYENVIGVQIDNETKAYDTAGPNVQHAFVQYLKEKFHGDLDAMNAVYGLDYWSNRINAWEDFPDVRGTINASLGAEFERFQRKITADYLMWQRNIVKPYLRSDQFITHNTDYDFRGYSFGMNPQTDVYEDAKAMDVVGTDIYHPSQDSLTGMEAAFGGDLCRSLKQDNYFVLETQGQGFAQWLPYPGQLRLQAYSHLASGANMVEYWHWYSLHNAAETYWKGILSQDFKENDTYLSCCQIGKEWNSIGSHLVNLKKKNHIAILVSTTAQKGLDWFPIAGTSDALYGYNDVLMELYRSLYELNLECDFIWGQNAEEALKNGKENPYDLIVIPTLYAASQDLLNGIETYVQEGGCVLATFKTAFADENLKVWSDEAPHALAKVFGISYSHFTYPNHVGFVGSMDFLHGEEAQHFMELLHCEGAKVLASYDHPAWKGYAAITRNNYGKGKATYIGCGLSKALLKNVVRDCVKEAEIMAPEEEFPLIVRKGKNDLERNICYVMNFSGKKQTYILKEDSTLLLQGGKAYRGEQIEIGPWDLEIFES